MRPSGLWKLMGAAAVMVAVLLVAHTPAPVAHAQEPGPPPGDCWNGALSEDPRHCYIFEEAQRAGEIDIAVVYVAPGDGPLYIFLSQTEPIGSGAISYLRAKTYEYLETVQNWHPSGPGIKCFDHTGDERRSCFDNVIGRPTWDSFGRPGVGSLPRSRVYEDIVLDVGGAEARRSKIGWASWRQLWPAPGPTGASGTSSGFDVSDVDTTNIPELDCDEEYPGASDVMWPSCSLWKELPEIGATGLHFTISYTPDKLYYQVKSPIPENAAELEALKQRLSGYKNDRYAIEIIPVKYDFGQLWQWTVMLDRFALSVGNTIGVTGAQIGVNSHAYSGIHDGKLVWMNGIEPMGVTSCCQEWSEARNILIVGALDPVRVAAALPQLLPLLGIPVDAVGLVAHSSARPVRDSLAGGEREVTVSSEPLGGEGEITSAPAPKMGDAGAKTGAGSQSGTDAELRLSKVSAAKPDGGGAADSVKTATESTTGANPEPTTGSEDATESDSSTASAAKSGGEVTSVKTTPESTTGANPEPETDSVAIPNRGDSGGLDAPSADATVVLSSTDSRWVLISVVVAVALAVAGSVVFVGVRRVRRRA